MDDWETYNSRHSTLELLKAVYTIQGYPNFEKVMPVLIKEIESRFDDIKPNRSGVKKKGNIFYNPSGLIEHKTSYYNQYQVIMSPFDVEIKEKKPQNQVIKHMQNIFKYAPNMYKLTGLQIKGVVCKTHKRFDEVLLLNQMKMAHLILKEHESEKMRESLLKPIYNKIVENINGKYDYYASNLKDFVNSPDVIITRMLVKSMFYMKNRYHGSRLSEYSDCEENYHRDYEHNSKKDIDLKFVLPNKSTINLFLMDGDSNNDDGKLNKIRIQVDTLEEFFTQFKKRLIDIKDMNVLIAMKKMGFDIKDEIKLMKSKEKKK